MAEQMELIAREREALLALEAIRTTIAAIPPAHPATSSLTEAFALAESHWQACQAAIAAAAKAITRTEANHPGDYWAARWRT